MEKLRENIGKNYKNIIIENINEKKNCTIHSIYFIKTLTEKYVVKVFSKEEKRQMIASIEIQMLMSKKNLAPSIIINNYGNLYTSYKDKFYFIQVFVEENILGNNDVYCQALAVKNLHYELSLVRNEKFTKERKRIFYEDIKLDILQLKNKIKQNYFGKEIYEKLEELVVIREKILNIYKVNYVPKFYAIIHGDIRPSNIIRNGDKYIFLDFDYVSWGDFIYSIGSAAMLLGNYSLEFFKEFLKVYLNDINISIDEVILDLMGYYVQSNFPVKLIGNISDKVVLKMIEERKKALEFLKICME